MSASIPAKLIRDPFSTPHRVPARLPLEFHPHQHHLWSDPPRGRLHGLVRQARCLRRRLRSDGDEPPFQRGRLLLAGSELQPDSPAGYQNRRHGLQLRQDCRERERLDHRLSGHPVLRPVEGQRGGELDQWQDPPRRRQSPGPCDLWDELPGRERWREADRKRNLWRLQRCRGRSTPAWSRRSFSWTAPSARWWNALDAEHLLDETTIIITAKHGQSPVDSARFFPDSRAFRN